VTGLPPVGSSDGHDFGHTEAGSAPQRQHGHIWSAVVSGLASAGQDSRHWAWYLFFATVLAVAVVVTAALGSPIVAGALVASTVFVSFLSGSLYRERLRVLGRRARFVRLRVRG
jgi:Flp pilus assembly protein TadB